MAWPGSLEGRAVRHDLVSVSAPKRTPKRQERNAMFHIVRPEDFTTASWKNGGGVNHEVLRDTEAVGGLPPYRRWPVPSLCRGLLARA